MGKEGPARETAEATARADRGVIFTASDHMKAMAGVAGEGTNTLRIRQPEALEAIADTEQDGFAVADDLTVTDTRTTYSSSELAARQTALDVHQSYIVMRATNLQSAHEDTQAQLAAGAATLRGIIPPQWNKHNGVQLVDNTTTTTPTTTSSTPPPPKCDPENVAELQAKVDAYERKFHDCSRRAEAHNHKPTLYDRNDPVQRKAYDDYKREEDALQRERQSLINEHNDLQKELTECGLEVGHDGALEVAPTSPTPTPPPPH